MDEARTLVFPCDDEFISRLDIWLQAPSEILEIEGRAAPKYDLLRRRVEELRSLCGALHPGPRSTRDRDRVIRAKLDVGVQEVVGDPVYDSFGGLRSSCIVCKDISR